MDPKEKLLQKLNEYGDKFLDTYEIKKKKKDKTKKEDSIKSDANDTNLNKTEAGVPGKGDTTIQKKKRKRKRKKSDKNEKALNKPKNHHYKEGGPDRHLEQIKTELGLDDFKEKQEKKQLEEEMKKQNKMLQESKQQPEVVVFHSRKLKEEKQQTEVSNKEPDKPDSEGDGTELDLEAARYDVHKFGISGVKGEQKEEAMKDLLIRLGAKPPKNKFYNYKEFQEMKKREREAAIEQRTWDRAVGNKVSHGGKGKGVKRKRDKNDVGAVGGQVGKYKSGVLFLKKKEVHTVKKSKVKR